MPKILIYNYLYLVPLFLGTLASLRAFRQQGYSSLQAVAILLCATLLVEIFAIGWKFFWHDTALWHYGKSNLWAYNAFLPVQFACISIQYYRALTTARLKKVIRAAIFGGVFWAVLNYALLEGPHIVNYFTIIPFHLFIIFMSLAYFSQMLHANPVVPLHTQPMAWVSLGQFLYNTGTLPFFLFLEYLSKTNLNLAVSLLLINQALNILTYFFYLISFLCKPQSQK